MTTIKAGLACKVTRRGALLDAGALDGALKHLRDYPPAEPGDTVVILGEFRTAGDGYKMRSDVYIDLYPEHIQFVQVLHPTRGTGWISTGYLEPIME